jgi:hypothetical protein
MGSRAEPVACFLGRAAVARLPRCEVPASGGFYEVCGVLVLAEGYFGLDAKYAAAGRFEQRKDLPAIFAIVNFRNLLPGRVILDLLYRALDDHRLVRFFGADDTMRLRLDVLRFACLRAGAEPEGVFPPDAPHHHQMRAPVWACG